MNPLTSSAIRGVWSSPLLPLNSDDSIDFSALEIQIEAMMQAGLAGIYTNGTAGEFHTQTETEFDRIATIVTEKCVRRGMPFQIGVSHMSAQVSLERLRRAKALGPGAFQVILPDWVPTSPTETETFLKKIAEVASPIGIVVYTPGHAKRPLDIPNLAKLRAAIPELVGVKTPDGNSSWYASVRKYLTGFSVFVPGHHLATGLRKGAAGSYSNIACLSPAGAQAWFAQMQTDPQAAEEFESRVLDFFQLQIAPLAASGISPAAIDKALCSAGRWCPISPRIRWPYQSVPTETVQHLAAEARRLLPELLRAWTPPADAPMQITLDSSTNPLPTSGRPPAG